MASDVNYAEPQDFTDDGNYGLHDEKFSLGCPAEDVYAAHEGERAAVLDMGRNMAELTIPSVLPPQNYRTGDKLPGNNQSMGSQAVSNLASRMMFMGFPPNQPMARFEPVETTLQPEIDKNPEVWTLMELALARLEITHRKRMETTPLRTAYVGLLKVLLVAGNGLWKHIHLDTPSFHPPTVYITVRDVNGHPLVTIHREHVSVVTMDADMQDAVYRAEPELKKTPEWQRKAYIYSVCKLVGEGKDHGKKTWAYWQEYDGKIIAGSSVETKYDDCPMWPAWLIPVYGNNWGRSYCEEYQGDLFTLESNASALNDGAALAGWAFLFVKPGGQTNIQQVRKAKNLEVLPGISTDVSTFKADKMSDMNFVASNFQQAARRIAAGFLLESSIRRDGERVTAEEITRMASDLDRAMGGLYTEQAQGTQRRIVLRFINLHEESNEDIPPLPDGLVRVEVVTGVDALGRSNDAQSVTEVVGTVKNLFPQTSEQLIDGGNFANRLAAAKGVKPDGLIKTPQQVQAAQDKQQQDAMKQEMVSKGTGPAAGALADRLAQQGAAQGTAGGAADAPPSPQGTTLQ